MKETAVQEKPILFSGAMVRAMLEGRKTHARRVCALQDEKDYKHGGAMWTELQKLDRCPYGKPGTHLWVRETWQPIYAAGYNHKTADWETGKGYAPSYPATDGIQEFQNPDDELTDRCWPSIHMKRWASRLTLEIVSVKVERVQDISHQDAIAEGCEGFDWVESSPYIAEPHTDVGELPVEEFKKLWEMINGKRGYGWENNPWVWAVEFKRLEGKR